MMTAQHVVPERLDAEDVSDLQEPLLGGSNESSVVPVCEDDFSCLRPIPFDVTQRLQSAAEVAIRDLMDGSSLFDTQEELPSLTLDPSKVGRRLGQGGYCCVYEYGETQAIKCLSDEAILSSQLTIGMTDLVCEAHILSVLNHPSIIHVHGVADHEQHYFVVLDRVRQTLWDHVQKQPSETRAITLLEFVQRLEWGLQIAQALQYLHSEKSIVYRDLKLDNIGIDDKGNVKLMDFGLAREMKQKSAGNHGRYCLSGKTGTFQNMAPEVAKEWSYNERVDVYSFGVVLWSLLTGKVPFTDMTEQEHLRLVVNGEERPLIPSEGWSRELQDLVTRSWSFFPNARPTMEVVTTGMQFLVSQYQQELDRQRRLQCQRRATLILLMALLGLMVIAFIVAFVLVRGAHVDSEIDHY